MLPATGAVFSEREIMKGISMQWYESIEEIMCTLASKNSTTATRLNYNLCMPLVSIDLYVMRIKLHIFVDM